MRIKPIGRAEGYRSRSSRARLGWRWVRHVGGLVQGWTETVKTGERTGAGQDDTELRDRNSGDR